MRFGPPRKLLYRHETSAAFRPHPAPRVSCGDDARLPATYSPAGPHNCVITGLASDNFTYRKLGSSGPVGAALSLSVR